MFVDLRQEVRQGLDHRSIRLAKQRRRLQRRDKVGQLLTAVDEELDKLESLLLRPELEAQLGEPRSYSSWIGSSYASFVGTLTLVIPLPPGQLLTMAMASGTPVYTGSRDAAAGRSKFDDHKLPARRAVILVVGSAVHGPRSIGDIGDWSRPKQRCFPTSRLVR